MTLKITDERLRDITSHIELEVQKLKAKLDANRDERSVLMGQLELIQQYCPHALVKHHPRQIAEDDPYDECEICGAQGNFGGPR